MKKIWGSILFGIARFLDVVLGGLILFLVWAVSLVQDIRRVLAPIFSCLVMMVIFNPFSLLLFRRKEYWIIALVLMVFPLLGQTFASFLEYGKYVLTEYLYDQADYYRLGKASQKGFSTYGPRYYRKKQQEAEARARERQRQQKEEWDRIFEEFFRSQGFQGYTYRQNTGGYSGQYQQQHKQDVFNPAASFVRQYKESCDTLGLPYTTDEYQVKLAYRKLAKKYHPDINKSPDATKKFQAINSAYEFLSKENIERYKRITG